MTTSPASAADVAVRAVQLDEIAAMVRFKAEVELELRGQLLALWEATPMAEQRYVADELAIVLAESPRTTQHWVEDSVAMACYPEVVELVCSGAWSVRHADAVLDELGPLTAGQRRMVLDLVLAGGARTPHELRKATRAAVYVVDPDAAERAAARAKQDRSVSLHDERNGAGSLVATGPKAAVAAALAGLDALCAVPTAGETRSLVQRRFDTLMDLITGRVTPVGASVNLLVSLATLTGESEEPGLIPGIGHVTAAEARELVADAREIRRVVVDENGELVAADSTVTRPEVTPEATSEEGTGSVLLTDQVEPAPVAEEVPEQLSDHVSDQEWLAAQLDAVATPDLAQAEAELAWELYNTPAPYRPETDPDVGSERAWRAGQATLTHVLEVLQAQQDSTPARPGRDAHVLMEDDGTFRVHWLHDDDPNDDTNGDTDGDTDGDTNGPEDGPGDGPQGPGGSGRPPPGPPIQPLPAGWVDDRADMRRRDAGLDLPSDPREAARHARLARGRRTLPSWVTRPMTAEDLALTAPLPAAPAPTGNDLAWWDTQPDHARAHELIAQLIPPTPRAPEPEGGWPTPPAPTPLWTPEALTGLFGKLLSKPPSAPPADSSGYLFRGALRHHIQLRDRTCRFPGCPRLARFCEIDHRIIYPFGPTSVWNGLTECDPHHDAKHAILTLTRLPDGTHRWTLRTGHYADVPPRPLLRGW